MVNQTELGRDVALPQPTVHRLNLLETSYQEEVDFVVEVDRRLVAIEVKGTERPRVEDSRHLRSFREEYKGHARGAPAPHR